MSSWTRFRIPYKSVCSYLKSIWSGRLIRLRLQSFYHLAFICRPPKSFLRSLFATNSYRISGAGKAALAQFFQSAGATSYVIAGHTDSRASDDYNMRLSLNRANAVAAVAQSVGARIADVRGYGERQPRASNGTARGMAKNRRVEIICIR